VKRAERRADLGKTATTTTKARATSADEHLKKDGTPDKRFKENKVTHQPEHLKKDGTPDKRFKENKKDSIK
jgi:hypothetical protein